MIDINLPLFPANSTAATVTTTVWFGVCVVVFFNLRFGWTLSGLVVPGYLVPLLLVKPVAVAIILAESIVTYLLVRQLSDRLQRKWYWSSFFGRDRFLAIILTSILVRAGADGWLLPRLGLWLNDTYGLQIDYRNDLHSYGLIVVALVANYLWKPGLWHGLTTSLTCVGITYAFMQYVVLEMTNLNLGSLQYLYDDMSTSLLSSPKAYVMVVTTAFVASQMNLRYAWDFNGILIPSLLGLLWHDPMKIATTFVESAWILILATAILRLPIWRRVTVEGGRKLLVFFTITAGHRLLLAHVMPLFSETQITDAYGFGYLLTTLMAVKAHDKQIPIRVWRATLQTSMMGATAGSMLGYGLSYLPAEIIPRSGPIAVPQVHELADESPQDGIIEATRPLPALLSAQRVQLYATKVPGSYRRPLPAELSAFRTGVDFVLQSIEQDDPSLLSVAVDALRDANYRISLVEDHLIMIHERQDSRGWGTFVLDQASKSPLLVEVPSPLEEWATLEAGYSVFSGLNASALAIGGTALDTNSDRSSDILAQRASMMVEFHRAVGRHSVLQIRGWTQELVHRMTDVRHDEAAQAVSSADTQLFVQRSMPPGLSVRKLNGLAQIADVHWRTTPVRNVLRELTPRGFAELVLSRYDRRVFRSRFFNPRNDGSLMEPLEPIRAYLDPWLAEDRNSFARQGSNEFLPPVVEEMLFLDNEVVTPLVHICRQVMRFEQRTAEQNEQLKAIAAAAASLGYELVLFHDKASDSDFFILVELAPKTRNWGTFVFRAGFAGPFVVEVPRPLYEQQTHPFGGTLLHRLSSAALLIAGAHPFSNVDGTADVTRMANRINAYQLVRQVLMREFSTRPMLFIQARAIQSPVEADVVVATDDGTHDLHRDVPVLVKDVLEVLENDGLKTRIVDGSEETAGYEVGIHFQAWVLNQSERKRMVSLWLSPTVRRKLRESDELSLASAQLAAIGADTVHDEIVTYLESQGPPPTEPVAEDAIAALHRYRDNSDITHLYQLTQRHPEYRLTRFVDAASDQVLILVQTQPGTMPTVINPLCLQQEEMWLDKYDSAVAREFVRSRMFLFSVRSQP